ncbi:MAG: hypothetical protein R2715_00755 [Ilumatobacteraceae bacterium]
MSAAGVVTVVLDATGDEAGSPLSSPQGLAVDQAGNVYGVTGQGSDNVFRIVAGGCSHRDHRLDR